MRTIVHETDYYRELSLASILSKQYDLNPVIVVIFVFVHFKNSYVFIKRADTTDRHAIFIGDSVLCLYLENAYLEFR